MTIEEAKAYYEKELKPSKNEKTASIKGHKHDENCSHIDSENLMWDKSSYRQLTGGHQAVLTPLHRKGVYIKVGEGKVVCYGLLNFTMMYRDSLNKIITERVLLKPSMNWFNGDRKNYDGSIIVYNWDGKVKKIFNFREGEPINSIKKINKRASVSGDEPSSNNEDPPCLVTTKYTLVGGRNCPCAGHTASQYNECTCATKPTQATLKVEVTIDCPPVDPEPPIPPTGGGGGNGESPLPGNGGGGGGSSGGDYIPNNCVPDDQIDYSIPLNPGEQYAVPCSQMPDPIELPNLPIPTTSYDRLILLFPGLTNAEKTYLMSHDLIADQLIAIIKEGDENSYDFTRWAIIELAKNTLTWEQFDNGFLTEYNEVQFDSDPSMVINNNWLNNNSFFTYQNLPTLNSFKNNYPKNADRTSEMSAGSVYFLVGGDILNMKLNAEKRGRGENWRNACALRVSLALNKSGINIPHIPDVTFRGKDINGKEAYFFIRASELHVWMMEEFYHGNRTDLTNADRVNANGDGFKNKLLGKEGIYIMIPQRPAPLNFGASGHAGIFTNPPYTEYYFNFPYIKHITLWELH